MGKGSDLRRLKTHWAGAVTDKRLATQLLKVRPFIYTACCLHKTASSVVELTEEPLAVVAVPRSSVPHKVVRLYDGVLWISARLSNFSRSVKFQCSNRFRLRGECFWLVRLLDYEVIRAECGDEFEISINLLSTIQEFHLTVSIFDTMPNVMSVFELSEDAKERPRVSPEPIPRSPDRTSTPAVDDAHPLVVTLPGVFAVPQPTCSSTQDTQPAKSPAHWSDEFTEIPAMNLTQLDDSITSEHQSETAADSSACFPETDGEALHDAGGNRSISDPDLPNEPLAMATAGSSRSLSEDAVRANGCQTAVQNLEPGDRVLVNTSPASEDRRNLMFPVSSSPTSKVGTKNSILQFLSDQARKLAGRLGFSSDDAIEISDEEARRSPSTSNASKVDFDCSVTGTNPPNQLSRTDSQLSSLGLVFRSLLHRVRHEFHSDVLQQIQATCNVRSRQYRRSSTLVSLCAPLVDSFHWQDSLLRVDASGSVISLSTSQTTMVNFMPDPPTTAPPDVFVTKSAPGRIRDGRACKRRCINHVDLLREIVRGVTEVSRIKLTCENDEKLRALSV